MTPITRSNGLQEGDVVEMEIDELGFWVIPSRKRRKWFFNTSAEEKCIKQVDLNTLKPVEVQRLPATRHCTQAHLLCFHYWQGGNVNLGPLVFNLFSSSPPIVVSPRPQGEGRQPPQTYTLQNVLEVPEVKVINIVDYDMVQQTSLASCEYPKGTNRFIKAGFTREKQRWLLAHGKGKQGEDGMQGTRGGSLGTEGGRRKLSDLREVMRMHIAESILDADGKIDQAKLHHVARLGGDW